MTATIVRIDHLCKAQFGEDRVLWRIFRGKTPGYFIEVGAYDGVHLSNTYLLERLGWRGLLIEPIEQLCRSAAEARPHSRVVHAACGKRGSTGTTRFTVARNVPVLSFLRADADHRDRCIREGAQLVEIDVPFTTLDDVLTHERRHAPPSAGPWAPGAGWQIDVVSIDTEGCELDVLDGFNLERFRPRILVIENDRPAGTAIEPYLRQHRYRKFHRRKINDFYIHCDDTADDLTLENLSSVD